MKEKSHFSSSKGKIRLHPTHILKPNSSEIKLLKFKGKFSKKE